MTEYKNITIEAEILLENLKKESKILDFKEELSHDGYDSEGPESDIWKLTVTILSSNTLKTLIYDRECWFDGNYEPYTLRG